MNISQLEREKFSVLSTITDDRKRNAQINAIKYIKTLASVSNTDIMHWNILDLFSKDGAVITDRTSINKVFFSYRENAPINPTTITEDKYAKLLKLTENRKKVSSSDLMDMHRRKMNDAINYYNNYYLKYLIEAAKYKRRHDALQGYTPNYAAEIEKLCSDGFWKLIDILSESIEFETVNDIILTYVNERHGSLMSVNMGKFRVSFNMLNCRLLAFAAGNNCITNSYIHPHVSSNSICFGELQNEAHDYIACGNLTATMEIAQKALTAYNDGSPYLQLENFRNSRKNIDEGRAWNDNGIAASQASDTEPSEFEDEEEGEDND
jgi:hypothetical protein